MTHARRRLVAFVVAPLLVVGLAACAQVEPEALPMPTPTPTETVAAPTLPTSRVPATCDELFTSNVVDGGTASPVADPVLTQAGYLGCIYDGMIGEKSASLFVVISVDPPADTVQNVYGRTGDLSFSDCADGFSVCEALFFSGPYAVGVSVYDSVADRAEIAPSFESFVAEIAERVSSWPPPEPAWQPPVDALSWSFDCEGAVVAQQDVVRDVVPFPFGDAFRAGSDAGYYNFWALDATGSTQCVWSDNGASMSVEILPGGAWMYEAGIPLVGEPYPLDGALAAALETQNGSFQLEAYIDGSFVQVRIDPPADSGVDGAVVARAVVTAMVTEF